MSDEKATCCPLCGGRNGYMTDIRFKADRYRSWDGSDIDTDNYEVTSERRPRCIDCGHSVRPPRLTKGTNE